MLVGSGYSDAKKKCSSFQSVDYDSGNLETIKTVDGSKVFHTVSNSIYFGKQKGSLFKIYDRNTRTKVAVIKVGMNSQHV